MTKSRSTILGVLFCATVFLGVAPARATETQPATTNAVDSDSGPLPIRVTAVSGPAQYRQDSGGKWQLVTEGMDLLEGVEFRTGPRGTIQFTIGYDQVCRVDRLSVVKVMRANVMPNGTIKTDMGLKYGRISKDVDEPKRTHDDTIVSPAATLSVRGTRVSLYDQPPYEPEAVSLTGQAVYHFKLFNYGVVFGAKGHGTASVAGGSPGAPQNKLNNNYVNPEGNFSGKNKSNNGQTPPPGGLQNTDDSQYEDTSSIVGAQTIKDQIIEHSGLYEGALGIALDWSSTTPVTVVNISVTSPLNETVSPLVTSAPSGGQYFGSNVASNSADVHGNYSGLELVVWGNTTGGNFPIGTYTVTETFTGVATLSGTVPSSATVTSKLTLSQTPFGSGLNLPPTTYINGGNVTLNQANPTETFVIKAPFTSNEELVPVSPGIAMAAPMRRRN